MAACPATPHTRGAGVCGPGGTVGPLSRTPEGFIGQMFAAMKPYAPLPPAGALLSAALGQPWPSCSDNTCHSLQVAACADVNGHGLVV